MVAIDIGTFFDTVLAWLQNTWTSLCADFYLNFIKEDRWKYLVRGLGVTLEVALFAAIAGIILGALLAIIRTTADKTGRLRFLNWLAKLYITVIRGTPGVVQLLIINFVIFSSVFVDTVLVAIIAFGLNSAAYVAEVFRSGIMSIDKGQMEAGRSLGLNYLKTMWFVIAPQVLKNVLPTLANEFITLLKETSVAGYVAVSDLTFAGNRIRGVTYSPFMPLIAVAIIYLILVMFLTRMVGKLERRLRQGDNR